MTVPQVHVHEFLWSIEQAWETVFKPFTMKIWEVIWIFMNDLWTTGSWKKDVSFLAEFIYLYTHKPNRVKRIRVTPIIAPASRLSPSMRERETNVPLSQCHYNTSCVKLLVICIVLTNITGLVLCNALQVHRIAKYIQISWDTHILSPSHTHTHTHQHKHTHTLLESLG